MLLSNSTLNITNASDSASKVVCTEHIPTAKQLFQNQDTTGVILTVVTCVFFVLTLAILIEEVYFLKNKIRSTTQKMLTFRVLALYPFYSLAGLLGVFVPRSGTLVDLIANIYLGSVLSQFLQLLLQYYGGPDNMLALLGGKDVALRAPPCCCIPCLPTVALTKGTFDKLKIAVLQVAFVRSLLLFLAAVLWTDESYVPGQIAVDSAYIYITVINIISSLLAMYGLQVISRTFAESLAPYRVVGKFQSIQAVILSTSLLTLIMSVLAKADVVPCSEVISSKILSERIFHCLLVVLLFPLSLLGRRFYRHRQDLEVTLIMENMTLNGNDKKGAFLGNDDTKLDIGTDIKT